MKIASLMTTTIALFSLLAVGEPIYAQQSDRQKTSVTINTDLVVNWANVLDSEDGKVVRGLEIDDFILREDGKPQQISTIKEGQPLSVVMIVWGVGCFRKSGWPVSRIYESLRQLGDDAEIALMSLYTDVAQVEPLTRDHNVIADWIYKGGRLLGETDYDRVCQNFTPYNAPRPGEAIYQAARYLEKAASPGRRKIIIVLTCPNTINKTHFHTAAEVNEVLEKNQATVYALYSERKDAPYQPLGDTGANAAYRFNRKDKRRRSGGLLEDFVEQTGGTTLIAKYSKDVDEMLMKLTGLISSSYTIGYYPENSEFDGKFRRISLELSPRGKEKVGKVEIKTRNGYRALRSSTPIGSEARPER
jgi:VWFA-related protein